jgi:hypothetical protein
MSSKQFKDSLGEFERYLKYRALFKFIIINPKTFAAQIKAKDCLNAIGIFLLHLIRIIS